jgi:hypothetical protein
MEIVPLLAQIGKSILVVSHLFSTSDSAAGSAPNPLITGEYKQQILVLYCLLTCFSTA